MTFTQSILSGTKYIAVVLLYLGFIVIVIYTISYIVIRHRKNKELEGIQRDIIREGRVNVKKFRLRQLFTSNNYSNPYNEGKIIAYVLAQNAGEKYSIFAVRKTPFQQTRFYKVLTGYHTDLGRDVTLKDWNFSLDENKVFFVKNEIKVNRDVEYDQNRKNFDTLGQLVPLVHKAILSNFEHRIRLRERKLIKLPEDEMRGNIR